MSKFVCKQPWVHFDVNNPNGDVTMCCDNETVLGNINQKGILEIWNDTGYQKIRKEMAELGAEEICPKNCPVIKGFKSFQNLDWYEKIPQDDEVFQNAKLNEMEFEERKLVLESKPRWMRFAASWVCNLTCYHCYQIDIRKKNDTLPDSFIEEMFRLSNYYQVLYFFGGEPFMYKPTTTAMERGTNPHCQYFFVTNATLLSEKHYELLEKSQIGHFAISLDAGKAESFDFLRKKGFWPKVMKNLERVAELKKRKNFTFGISMTVNSVNCNEIEDFVDIGIKNDAEPILILVSNSYGELEFQKKYLHFSKEDFVQMRQQVKISLEKIKDKNWPDAKIGLNHFLETLEHHEKGENKIYLYNMKRKMKYVFDRLPESLQRKFRNIWHNIIQKTA